MNFSTIKMVEVVGGLNFYMQKRAISKHDPKFFSQTLWFKISHWVPTLKSQFFAQAGP